LTASPLRYPGGKASMAGLLQGIRRLNALGNLPIAEPFAGGAGASLSLLFKEDAPEIYINDADTAIYGFWWSILKQSRSFQRMLATKRVSMSEWRRQRDLYRSTRRQSSLRRGFAAFYLNRCNRSGIIPDGGPIGGIKQNGRWKLDARYNKATLLARCERIAEYGDRIHLSCADGTEFIASLRDSSVMYFVDPPYFEKGQLLYMNALTEEYHRTLSERLRSLEGVAWVLTYDDCPEIRAMYQGWASIRPFTLRYSAAERRSGRELLITPRWLRLPSRQPSDAIAW